MTWHKEPGARLAGSRDLDRSKVQAPCVVPLPGGGFRLFYTAVGPGKPFAECQGYILSAISDDGLEFRTEPGFRLMPQPAIPNMSLRVLSPTLAPCESGHWRMYFESRGRADRPTVICSAVSNDLLNWRLAEGIRLEGFAGVGGPRYCRLPDGRERLYCFRTQLGPDGKRIGQSIVSAISTDGFDFQWEPGDRMRDKQAEYDSAGITAAEVVPPAEQGGDWLMAYSAWQDIPPGYKAVTHPSHDALAVEKGLSADFAAASIASDLSGYRSRIYMAHSRDGLEWHRAGCAIEGTGYDGDEIDAVHAEDMSLVKLPDGRHRMYYAACDRRGNWRIASAIESSPRRSATG